jgi:glycosyltransferase involved in cell wall biosynthesis
MAPIPSVAVVIPSYNGVIRVAGLLSSIIDYDPQVLQMVSGIHVFEDPCGYAGVAKSYDRLQDLFPVTVHHIPTWSNMHGAAQYAFEHTPAEWIVYLGDDVLVTPQALSNLVYFLQNNRLETVALVQPAYWNAHELTAENYSERQGPVLLNSKEEMYTRDQEWLTLVPRNKHWDGHGLARPYVNVNGVGFASRRFEWLAVGGFCLDTWCLDESLSVRTWLNTRRGIVCLPGPPLVHFFGGATISSPPSHDLHTHEAWVRGMHMTKEEAGRLSYKRMFEMSDRINEEMRTAHYLEVSPCVL